MIQQVHPSHIADMQTLDLSLQLAPPLSSTIMMILYTFKINYATLLETGSRDNRLCMLIILASFLANRYCTYTRSHKTNKKRGEKGSDGGRCACAVGKKKIIFPKFNRVCSMFG